MEKILDTASFHTLPAWLPTPSQQLPSNLVKNIFSSTYIKFVELVITGYDTQPVGTVMQKSLKVPEWQFSALHSQDRNQKRRICS